jgi:hypothetical protein
MTLTKFIRALQRLEAAGHGRANVVVAPDTLWDGRGTFNIADIHGAEYQWTNVCDGDGFTIENKDGSLRGRPSVILYGVHSDEMPGRPCPSPPEPTDAPR